MLLLPSDFGFGDIFPFPPVFFSAARV